MGKHTRNKNSSKYNHKSSWLATMFHVLDFHYWRTKNRPICWKTPRTHSSMHETNEQEPFLDSTPTRQETKVNSFLEYVDCLEILRKEDVFVKILKDPNSEFEKQVQIKSNPRVCPKSVSFPLSNSSRSSSIDHKQKENWYTPKQNVAVLTLNVPKESSHAVIKGFRELKKLIKNALKDRKNTKKKKSKFSDEYIGRYSKLLEQSFRRNGGELSSRSLRLSYEDKNDDKPQFFRRISSLSSLEVRGSFLIDLFNDCSSRKSFEQDTNFGSLVIRTEKEDKSDEEQEERSKEDYLESPNHMILQQQQDSVPETCFLDSTEHKTETILSQGLKPLEVNNHEEDTYFYYVKKLLEVSGFLENEDNIEQWYSEDQPLNPSILYELEETVNEELLFDLVNEAIAETHTQSQMYFPKAFSIRKRFLDEVWRRVEWSLNGLGAEYRDVSLDDIVGNDLSKSDGWMNLNGGYEWISLELEDMIFDEVLDDLLCVYS